MITFWQAHKILKRDTGNPVHKLMDLSSSMLNGVAKLCALNSGKDVGLPNVFDDN